MGLSDYLAIAALIVALVTAALVVMQLDEHNKLMQQSLTRMEYEAERELALAVLSHPEIMDYYVGSQRSGKLPDKPEER